MIAFQPLSMNKRRHQVKPEAQTGMYLMQVISLISAQVLSDISCNYMLYYIKWQYFVIDNIAGRQSAPQPLPRLLLHLQPSVQVIMTTEMFSPLDTEESILSYSLWITNVTVNSSIFVRLRQDSELQSVSSHNDTTDDNQSSFTESSSHYSNTYRWWPLKSSLFVDIWPK